MPFNPFKYSKRKRRTSTTDFHQLSSQQDTDTVSQQSVSSSFDSGSQVILIPNQNNHEASRSGSLNNSFSSTTSSPKRIIHHQNEEEIEIQEDDGSSPSIGNNLVLNGNQILRQSTADLASIHDFTTSLIQEDDDDGGSSHAMIELTIDNDDQIVFGSSPTSSSPPVVNSSSSEKKVTTPRRRASFNSLDRSTTNIQRVSSVDNNENDRRIQRQIELDSKKPKKVRVLTLGSGKSGKSTLIRKIKLLEGDYSNEQVVELYKCKILKFVLNNAKYLIKNVQETEFRENLRRRAQLLQLWRFNKTLNEKSESNTTANGSDCNTSQPIPISPRNKSPLRVSSSLDESLNVLHQRLSNFSSHSKQRFKQPSQHDIQAEEANSITQNFLNPEAVELFKSLWKDRYVKNTFDKLALNNSILYNARYFFDNIDRIASLRYTPTSRDILTTYFPSNSIETCQLNFPFPCEFVDITGQRNERRKWMTSHFDRDSVSAIVFMVSLSEYCEYSLSFLDVSPTKNQSPPIVDPLNFVPATQNQILVSHMHNSLSMFKEILTFYKETPIILVFTKLDIFRKRIKSVPLQKCFPDFDYSGDHVFLYTSFVAEKFINIDPTIRQRCLYTHFVDLIREDASVMVMDDIKDIILQKTLRDHGLF